MDSGRRCCRSDRRSVHTNESSRTDRTGRSRAGIACPRRCTGWRPCLPERRTFRSGCHRSSRSRRCSTGCSRSRCRPSACKTRPRPSTARSCTDPSSSPRRPCSHCRTSKRAGDAKASLPRPAPSWARTLCWWIVSREADYRVTMRIALTLVSLALVAAGAGCVATKCDEAGCTGSANLPVLDAAQEMDAGRE